MTDNVIEMMNAPSAARAGSRGRKGFYDRIATRSMAPLWEVLRGIAPPEPVTGLAAHVWRWEECRSYLIEAGDLLSADEAQRRALLLENPTLSGKSRTTGTLTGAIQLVLPKEVAPAHRHTQTAVRFVIESDGGFTTVDGERTPMRPGDFIVTPSWAFHDHGNHGETPLLFLDVVDMPISAFFSTGFSGLHNDAQQLVTRPEGDSLARFGAGLLPLEAKSPYGLASPVFNYPYQRTRAALATIARNSRPDVHWGHTLRFSNPVNGGWATPTIANWMTLLPPDFITEPLRSTDALIIAVAEGSGTVQAGERRLILGPGDVVVVPNWSWRHFSAGPDGCVLFVASDRAAQEKLDLWREERRLSQ
jgi:gentisate 1,2-dioxygenase